MLKMMDSSTRPARSSAGCISRSGALSSLGLRVLTCKTGMVMAVRSRDCGEDELGNTCLALKAMPHMSTTLPVNVTCQSHQNGIKQLDDMLALFAKCRHAFSSKGRFAGNSKK